MTESNDLSITDLINKTTMDEAIASVKLDGETIALGPVTVGEPIIEVNDPGPEPIEDILDILMKRIGTVDEVSPYLKLFIFGPFGSGKTVFTASAPGRVLHIDIEDGAKAIRNHPNLKNNVDVLPFKSVAQVDILLTNLAQRDPRLDVYNTIVLDSFTAFQSKALTEHTKMMAGKDSSRNPFLPQDGDYNLNTQTMRDYAKRLHDLDRHVIVTCLSQEVKEESTGRILIRPELTAKLSSAMGGIFDLVGFITSETDAEGKFTNRLQVHPTEKIAAKTRIGGLPPVINSPTFQILLDAYNRNN